MILSDFGGSGVHFLMIFEYFKCLGTPPGGLGAHFEPKARIFVISITFRNERGIPFWGPFWILFASNFQCFFECPFFWIFCDLGCPMAPKWEPFGGHFDDIFEDRLFLDFCYPYCTKPWFLRSGGHPNCIIFGNFFEGALRKASGTRFFTILNDLGLPGGDHLAPKRHQKQGPKKVVKNGTAGSTGNRLWAF